MRVTRRQLKQIIREERTKLRETDDLEYIDPMDDANIGMALNYKLDELVDAIENASYPEDWAERYPRSARSLMGSIDAMIDTLSGMGF